MKVPNFEDSYIVFELTNLCNLKCKHCIQSYDEHLHTLDSGFLDPEILYRAIEDMGRAGIKFHNLILFWIGEPLMHPKFKELYPRILELNREHQVFRKIEVHTNGNLLRPEVRELATNDDDSIFQVWHCTIDAATAEVYEGIKGKNDFAKVEGNVRELVALKAHKGARYPKIVFQFIVHEANVHEAPLFLDRWRGLCADHGLDCRAAGFHPNVDGDACVFFRQLDCLDVAEQERSNAIYLDLLGRLDLLPPRKSEKKGLVDRLKSSMQERNSHTCSGFFKSPVVNWDGRMTTCTRDNEMLNVLGDLRQESFSDIWWRNPRLEAYRAQAIDGSYRDLEVCQTCIIPKSANYTNMTRDEIKAYQRFADGRVILRTA